MSYAYKMSKPSKALTVFFRFDLSTTYASVDRRHFKQCMLLQFLQYIHLRRWIRTRLANSWALIDMVIVCKIWIIHQWIGGLKHCIRFAMVLVVGIFSLWSFCKYRWIWRRIRVMSTIVWLWMGSILMRRIWWCTISKFWFDSFVCSFYAFTSLFYLWVIW